MEARLVLAGLDPRERERLEPRLIRAANACGCSSGAISVLIAAVAVVVWWVTAPGGRAFWPKAGWAALALLAAAVAGKLAGIGFARVWLRLTLRRYRHGHDA